MFENNLKKKFGINDPVCTYKLAWSTIRLWESSVSNCHRVKSNKITADNYYNFHNTPGTLQDRTDMQNGKWPDNECHYCKRIEDAGGVSDRMEINSRETQLYVPIEIYKNKDAINLTPTMVEVYFNNLCNLSCIYCESRYSSVWEQEDIRFNTVKIHMQRSPEERESEYTRILNAHWIWLSNNHDKIKQYLILGGEPFFQQEFYDNITFFEENPSPNLTVTIFSNFKVDNTKFKNTLHRLSELKRSGKLHNVEFICSFDCWGKEIEYIRSGLNLSNWERNFVTALNDFPEVGLRIHSTLTSLAIPAYAQLCEKVYGWERVRPVGVSISFVDGKPHMHPGIFPTGFFKEHFESARKFIDDELDLARWNGFEKTIDSMEYRPDLVSELKSTLDELDRRRGTNWKTIFKWLDEYEV